MKTRIFLAFMFCCSLVLAAPTNPGDVNDDGVVDVSDLIIVLSDKAGTYNTRSDANNDGVINLFDLVLAAKNYGATYQVSNPNLVLHLDFNEGSGTTVRDQSSNGNDGTITGATYTAGVDGTGLLFDGNDLVTIPYDSSLATNAPYTIAMWMRVDDITDSQFNHGFYSVPSRGFGLITTKAGGWVVNNKVRLASLHANNIQYFGWDLPYQRTFHFTITWDGATMREYINGTQVGTISQGLAPTIQNENILIGRGSDTAGNIGSFIGMLDEVKVFNAALSAADVQNLYAGTPITPPSCTCSGLACNPANNGQVCNGCNYVAAASEVCSDGIDNDCDGTPDDGCVACTCSGTACNPANNGQKCNGCTYTAAPSEGSTCNSLDDDCDGTADDGLVCTQPPTGTYPNKPVGMTMLTRWDGTSLTNAGWQLDSAWNNQVSLQADPTNPAGTGSVLRVNFNQGSNVGPVPVINTWPGGPYDELYFMYRIYIDPNWDETPGQKIFYWGSNGFVTAHYATREMAAGEYRFNVQDNLGKPTALSLQNFWSGARGNWVNVEIYAKRESIPGAGDGIVRVYKNGVLQGQSSTVQSFPYPFQGMEWYMFRNNVHTQNEYFLIGELSVWGKNTSAPSANNEPSGMTQIIYTDGSDKYFGNGGSGTGWFYGARWLDNTYVQGDVPDATSPHGTVIEKRSFVGDVSGWNGLAQYNWASTVGVKRHVYFRSLFKFSSNYQICVSDEKPFGYLGGPGGDGADIFIGMKSSGAWDISNQLNGAGWSYMTLPFTMTKTQWIKLEMYLIAESAAGASDGEMYIWVDDTLVKASTGLDWSSGTPGWSQADLFNYWGGGCDGVLWPAKAVNDKISIGEIYISGK